MTLSDHTVSAFDDDLNFIISKVSEMGGIAESMLARSMVALKSSDKEMCKAIIKEDKVLGNLQREVDEAAVLMIAKRQPMAQDLREVIGALRISTDLERIGDLGKNVAKRSLRIEDHLPPKKLLRGLQHLTDSALEQLKDALDAYVNKDTAEAREIWERDDEIDNLYTSVFRELLTYMMEDPRNMTFCIHLLFCAKNMERVGDHATNLAETIHYIVTGSSNILEDDDQD